jgi:Zn-dependent protease with chaperone function
MPMSALGRRAFLAGGAGLLAGGCQPEGLKLSDLNPLARRELPPRSLDRALAIQTPFAAAPEQRRLDFAEALTRGDMPGFANLPTLESYCAEIVARLSEPLAKLALPLRCEILASRDPGAFAYPSGIIFLTHGIFREIDSEDALAFLIGHEIGHIALRHHDTGLLDQFRRYAILGAETYASFSLGARGGGAQFPGWLAASYAANIVGRDFISPNWNRSQEDEADRMAVDLMVAAGYNVAAVQSAMELLHRAENAFGYKTSTEMTAAEEQLARESEELRARSAAEGDSNPLTRAMTGAVEGVSSGLDTARRNHRTPEERSQLLHAYLDAEYADAPEPSLRRASYESAMRARPVAEVVARYEAAIRLIREPSAMPQAQFDLRTRQLSAGIGARDSYVQCAIAKSLFARNQIDRAMAHFTTATGDVRPGALAFGKLADWHAENRRPRDALAAYDRVVELYAESASILMGRLRNYRLANMSVEATTALARCVATRPELARECQRIVAQTQPLS